MFKTSLVKRDRNQQNEIQNTKCNLHLKVSTTGSQLVRLTVYMIQKQEVNIRIL